MRSPTAGDRGAGTVATVGLVAGIVALAALLAPVGAISVARHRAAAAADAAALAAGAIVAGFGSGIAEAPCDVAAAVARRHDAALRTCTIDGLDVVVEATVGTAFGEVAARAAAGPARTAFNVA